LVLTLSHSTLTHRVGASAAAAATVTTTRATLDSIMLQKMEVPEALSSGALRIEGDASRLEALFGMFDPPSSMMFDVLTVGEGRS